MRKSQLKNKLKKIGPTFLRPEWKARWNFQKPTTGYCYLISEILFHFLYPNAQSYVINLGLGRTHWFLKQNGKIIDWTSDQFTKPIPYQKARRAAFFIGAIKTPQGKISRKAYALAQRLEITR
jgi:hypothetical protein